MELINKINLVHTTRWSYVVVYKKRVSISLFSIEEKNWKAWSPRGGKNKNFPGSGLISTKTFQVKST